MSIEKIIYTGVLSYIIIATNRTLELAFKFNLYETQKLGVSLLYLLSSILTFVSFYALCSYTDRSSIAGKINLIAVFSIIPMLAFDCVNILSYFITEFESLYTRSILFAAASAFSSTLFLIFIVGLYKYKVSPSISRSFKGLILISSILTIINIIDSSITIAIGNFEPSSIVLYILKLVLFIYMVVNYKYIVLELIKIAQNHSDKQDEDDYLIF
ncbi:MAG: hypothetical protein RR838_04790 [Clostridium sp.]